MKTILLPAIRLGLLVILTAGLVIIQGCATRVDWGGRVGTYTYDETVKEMGPPDKSSTRDDGTTICEWVTQRGSVYNSNYNSRQGPYLETYNPGTDEILRLTFGKDGKLAEWRYLWK